MASEELVGLEEEGWQALSTDGEAAVRFYGRVLDASPVFLLPGGMRLTDRDVLLTSMSGAPWSRYTLEDPQVLDLDDGTAIVHYGVVAHREGAAEYSALVSSGYVRRADGWKLAFHQQTPR